ncbi:MAG: RNA 2',3'-cyclic phosphodiesterase [Bacteroidetes bacterium HGW-Bacteroidetes-4]|jgi:2'-5' RNA ligase|nr:MAG: RNA 2',3'-cyclic phosphodiesterase [Bacteroidetes bacterium HGW-Bacteroidetes-4]
MKRLFLALELPQYFKEKLIADRSLFLINGPVRWVSIENLHVTLFFIGDFNELMLDKLKEELNLVLNNQQVFELELDKLVLMPKKRPYMIWAQFKPNQEFNEMYKKVALYFSQKPNHEIIIHTTLARFKGYTDIVLSQPLPTEISVQIKQVVLYESKLKPSGVEYFLLKKYKLSN